MRMEIRHPQDKELKAVVGLDPAIGWLGEVRRKGRKIGEYDAFTSGRDNSLQGLLGLLVRHNFFEEFDVLSAHRALQHDTVGELESDEEKLAAEVIEKLKAAAAD